MPVTEPVEFKCRAGPFGLPTIDAAIDGQPIHAVLDTGAGLPLIDRKFAEARALARPERVRGLRNTGAELSLATTAPVRISIGPYDWSGPSGVFDLRDALGKACDIDAALALPCFREQPLTIDLSAGLLKLESDASLADLRRTVPAFPIDLRETASHALEAFLSVGVEGLGHLTAQLDSGADAILVDEKLSLPGSSVSVWPGDFTDLRTTYAARTKKLIYDMVLGLPFFASYRLTFDLRRAELFIARAAPSSPSRISTDSAGP